jgi:hypothetical protein
MKLSRKLELDAVSCSSPNQISALNSQTTYQKKILIAYDQTWHLFDIKQSCLLVAFLLTVMPSITLSIHLAYLFHVVLHWCREGLSLLA